MEFYISSPGTTPGNRRGHRTVQRPAQVLDLKVQISAAHVYDEEAGVLVVTNVKTLPDQFEAIGQFIRNDLHLKMDVYNVSLYGGLTQPTEKTGEDEAVPSSVLNGYRG